MPNALHRALLAVGASALLGGVAAAADTTKAAKDAKDAPKVDCTKPDGLTDAQKKECDEAAAKGGAPKEGVSDAVKQAYLDDQKEKSKK